MLLCLYVYRSSQPEIQVRVRPAAADETSELVTRNRTRANHVFGGPATKPPATVST